MMNNRHFVCLPSQFDPSAAGQVQLHMSLNKKKTNSKTLQIFKHCNEL